MRNIKLLTVMTLVLTMFCACNKPDPIEPEPTPPGEDTTVVEPKDDIYQFSVLDGNGDSVSLAQYRGKVLLVVNTATQCGYTPQYTQLQQWYETYEDRGFVILDFPCNQFGGQAPVPMTISTTSAPAPTTSPSRSSTKSTSTARTSRRSTRG